jgi:hypothetical protein
MKKSLLFSLAILALSIPVGAQTDPKTAEFLNKVNLYYYCLNREGLKSLTCEVTFDLPGLIGQIAQKKGGDPTQFNNVPKQKYKVTVKRNGDVKIDYAWPKTKRGSDFKKMLVEVTQGAGEALKGFLEGLTAVNFRPLFTPEDLAKNKYQVQTKDYGFDANAVNTNMRFDKQVRLTELVTPGTATSSPDFKFDYLAVPQKGWLVSGFTETASQISLHAQMDYQTVGKYQLPKTLTITNQSPDPDVSGTSMVFQFTDYRLNN